MATDYREVLLSRLYPGGQTSLSSLQPVVAELQRLLPMSWDERQRTLIRTDAGFGGDDNLNWLLQQGYQVLAKGYSGKRAKAFSRRVDAQAWLPIIPDKRWVAWSPVQVHLYRPTRTVIVRWLNAQHQEKHALYLTSLTHLSLTDIAALYDDRACAEVEIQADKMGLFLAKRRKHSFEAQEMLILLNDWAHNLLAWFHAAVLRQTAFDSFGPKRIVRDLFTIPAEALLVDNQLIRLDLKQSHPYAAQMADCLNRLWQYPPPSML